MSLIDDMYEEFQSVQRQRDYYSAQLDKAMRALADVIVERDALRAQLPPHTPTTTRQEP